MTTLTPDEVEVGRRNLTAVLKSGLRGRPNVVELHPQTVRDLIAVLEASKPTVVDRAALQNTLHVKLVSLGVDEFFDPQELAADLSKMALGAVVTDEAVEAAAKALDEAACVCPTGRNQYGGWYSPQPTCPACGDNTTKSRVALEAASPLLGLQSYP